MASDVPFLEDEFIEREALMLLAEFAASRGKVIKPPVPIEDILEKHLKLDLDFDDVHALVGVPRRHAGSEPDVLGAIFMDERRIVIDESLDPETDSFKEGRFRFTLAHEGGHWRLHRKLFARDAMQRSLLDEDPAPNVVCRTSQKKARIEYQADCFASCVLMPRKLVLAAWDAEYPDRRPRVLKPAEPVEHPFVEVPLFGRDIGCGYTELLDNALIRVARPFAERFCVSPLAMRIRLEKLGLLHRSPPLQRRFGERG